MTDEPTKVFLVCGEPPGCSGYPKFVCRTKETANKRAAEMLERISRDWLRENAEQIRLDFEFSEDENAQLFTLPEITPENWNEVCDKMVEWECDHHDPLGDDPEEWDVSVTEHELED